MLTNRQWTGPPDFAAAIPNTPLYRIDRATSGKLNYTTIDGIMKALMQGRRIASERKSWWAFFDSLSRTIDELRAAGL
jgi:hypothetical protein